MAKQNIDITRNDYENNILDLEKYYFDQLVAIINSENFKSDLKLIEKEIKDNYSEYENVWKLKNKIKIPAERLVRHNIYTHWSNIIEGIYPSPVSSDIGIKLNDAIVCIDIKTLDTIGNRGDISSTQVEQNQTSFDNKNYPYIKTASNLKAIDHYSRLPVLTYIVKIIYTDDNYSFKLSRNRYPSLVVVAIPNGKISKLFDYNIIENVKTYSYYDENDGEQFKPIAIPSGLNANEKTEYVENICVNEKGFAKISINRKTAYLDPTTREIWWQTSISKKPYICAVKSVSNARFINNILKERYDANNDTWNGYVEITLQ